MAQTNWEKASAPAINKVLHPHTGRWKYWAGGLLILGAVAYLILSNTLGGVRYFINVSDLVNDAARYTQEPVRVTGAVIGDTIVYDPENMLITFTVASIPDQYTDLGQALHDAVNDPNATRLNVRVENQVKPELLQQEAQAIMNGYLGADGIFHVNELQMKCPTRFSEIAPDGSVIEPGDHPVIANPPAGAGV